MRTLRKLQKDARQSEKKPKERPSIRIPFEPIPLHVPVRVPDQGPADRREDSISTPRGVIVIDYGD